ncbi:hypothetical protein os1_13700 [Comamonadaceae bacterium OS-1]|nr:hypothetical protein os1_13700 [Comamonadaceae bacterium OS-1]
MIDKSAVLLVGWHPNAVDYRKWPGLTPDKLWAGFEADRVRLEALGYNAELGLIESADTADQVLTQLLTAKPRHCVLIGAGVRTIPDYLHLFEKLVNTVHTCAPHAKICFNSGPFDSVDAIQRWVPASAAKG